MFKKTRSIYVSVLTLLAVGYFGLVVTSAWSTSSLTTALAPPTCSSPGCVIGTSVTDSATITATAESICNTQSCNYGTVTFQVFKAAIGTGCASTGAALSGFGGGSPTLNTVSVPSTLKTGSASVTSGSFSTTGLAAGNYVWIVNYVSGGGSNSWPSYGPKCEAMTLTSPPTGVPEFPIASLGMIAMLALMFPALLFLRSKFARQVTF